MGWQNPPIPWSELERRLSGRPPQPAQLPSASRLREVNGDGGDSPAWSRKRPAYQPSGVSRGSSAVPYAELHAHSSFSFLDGASDPEEMVEEAVRLGLEALALTDHDGMYGIVRFAEAAESHGLPTVFGAELSLDVEVPRTQAERMVAARVGVPDPPGRHLSVLARDPQGYADLCRVISAAQLRGGAKGRPVHLDDELTSEHWLVLTGCRKGPLRDGAGRRRLRDVRPRPGARACSPSWSTGSAATTSPSSSTHARDPLADERYEALVELADEARLAVVATTGAHYHGPPRRPLATAMAAVRARSSLDEVDGWLPAWADQHLRSGVEMAERFARWPDAVATAARLGKELAFPLKLIAPQLPPFPVPAGHTEMTYLRELAAAGAADRYGPRGNGDAHTEKAYRQIEHELDIIEQLGFPGYFLVVWEIARFCRERGILCQGRGSAANSAVCYAIGVTAVDAVKYGLLFERFLAPHRDGPPDIDLDIESDRREEAIQHVYATYDRRHAAQVANVITYRPKSAVRDVAKALGYSQGQQDAWSKEIELGYSWSDEDFEGGDVPPLVLELAAQLQNAPRHLGIHSGGMVICDRPVVEVCPVEWGRMENRTVLQWDKDDCATVGLVKFDLLGLGMLSALHYCFDFVEQETGRALRPAHRARRGPAGLRDALPGRLRRGVPGRVPGADGDPAAVAAAPVLRPGHRDRADPPRPHPGRVGAPVHPAQARP